MHEMKFFNGILETPDEAIERIDDIGGPHSHTNYPWGGPSAVTHHFVGTNRTPTKGSARSADCSMAGGVRHTVGNAA